MADRRSLRKKLRRQSGREKQVSKGGRTEFRNCIHAAPAAQLFMLDSVYTPCALDAETQGYCCSAAMERWLATVSEAEL